jgi:predicted RNase H-like nuclease (RuvC/YqgF family)
MTESEKTIATFQTRVRDLISHFQALKKENSELYDMIEKDEHDIQELKAQLEQKDRDYIALKTARMIEVTDSDLQESKTRLAKLIRDVDKCIAILSDEK